MKGAWDYTSRRGSNQKDSEKRREEGEERE